MNNDNMRWLRFRIAAFQKDILQKRREGESVAVSGDDIEWARSVYDGCEHRIFPDVGIYILYFNEFGYMGIGSLYSVYKIGLSDRMRKRWLTLQTGTPIPLRPIHVIETSTLNWTETWLHNALRSRRIDDNQEWFALSADDLKVLLTIEVLNKQRTTEDEVRLLELYEMLNPPDTKQGLLW